MKGIIGFIIAVFLMHVIEGYTQDFSVYVNPVKSGKTLARTNKWYKNLEISHGGGDINLGIISFYVDTFKLRTETSVQLKYLTGLDSAKMIIVGCTKPIYGDTVWSEVASNLRDDFYLNYTHTIIDTIEINKELLIANDSILTIKSDELTSLVNKRIFDEESNEVILLLYIEENENDYLVLYNGDNTNSFPILKLDGNEIQNPASIISDDKEIFKGETDTIKIKFSGTAPYSFIYSDGTNNFSISTNEEIYELIVDPDSTTVFSLVEAYDAHSNLSIIDSTLTVYVKNQSAHLCHMGDILLDNPTEKVELKLIVNGILPASISLNNGETYNLIHNNDSIIEVIPEKSTIYNIISASDRYGMIKDIEGLVRVDLTSEMDCDTIIASSDTYVEMHKTKGDRSFPYDNEMMVKNQPQLYDRYGYINFDISTLSEKVDFASIGLYATLIRNDDVVIKGVLDSNININELTFTTHESLEITNNLAMNIVHKSNRYYNWEITNFLNLCIQEKRDSLTLQVYSPTSELNYSKFSTLEKGLNSPFLFVDRVFDSTANHITSFELSNQTGPAIIDTSNHTIAIEVANGTVLTNLRPEITVSGFSTTIYPTSGMEQDFSEPVIYTVTAPNGDIQEWTVNVKIQYLPSSKNNILAFILPEQSFEAVIDTMRNTIEIEVTYGTDITSLIPEINISEGARIEPESGVNQDFTNPFIYKVFAEDGSVQEWIIKVTIAPSTNNDIIMFELGEQSGNATIDTLNHTITIEVVAGTDIKSLIPEIEVSEGAIIEPESGVVQDFTNPVHYKVMAEDSTVQEWIITVNVEQSPENDITKFELQEQSANTTIDTLNHTVTIEVVAGTDITSLIPAIEVSEGAKIAPESGLMQDFTNFFIYKVIAEDSTVQEWIIVVELAESASEYMQEALSIYPNPAKDIVYLSGRRSDDIHIYDITGNLVYRGKNINKLNISYLTAGIYIIKVGDGIIQKLIVE